MLNSGVFFVSMPSGNRGYTGANIGSLVVLESLKKEGVDVSLINYSAAIANPSESGKLLRRVFYYFVAVGYFLKSYLKVIYIFSVKRNDFFYFLPSSSFMGLLRDILLVATVKLISKNVVIIGHSRNGNYLKKKRKIKEKLFFSVIDRIDRLIVLSQMLLGDYCKDERLLAKIHVVPNSIDSDIEPNYETVLCKAQRRRDTVDIVYFSNFIETKGYKLLADVINILAEEELLNNYRFSFYGKWYSDREKSSFLQCFPREAIEHGYVSIHGAITDRKEAAKILLDNDVFCLPTYYPVEAQPRSIIEALANGCVILSTKHASIPEMVPGSYSHLLCDAGSVESLYGSVKKLLNLDIESCILSSRSHYDSSFSNMATSKILYKVFS